MKLADVAMQTEVINGHLIEVTIGGHTEYLTASMLGAAKRKLASVTSRGWVNVNGLRLDESQVDHCIGALGRECNACAPDDEAPERGEDW